MASITTRYPDGVSKLSQLTNATQAGDPTPAGFTTWDAAGVPTQRALTATEVTQLAAMDAANVILTNQATLQQQAQTALANNRTFIAVATPASTMTLAQQQQLWNQVKALTQQHQALIRLAINQFDATN